MINILTICISGTPKAHCLLWLLLGTDHGYWPPDLDSGACDSLTTVERSAPCEATCRTAVRVEVADSVLFCGFMAAPEPAVVSPGCPMEATRREMRRRCSDRRRRGVWSEQFRVYFQHIYTLLSGSSGGERGRGLGNVPDPASPDGDQLWSIKLPAGSKMAPFRSLNR